MKKILLIILSVFASLMLFTDNVFAYENFKKIEIKTAFEESIDLETLGDIYLSFDLSAREQGYQDVEEWNLILTKEENYHEVYNNSIIYGELFHKGTRVGLDAGSQTYDTTVNVTYPEDKVAIIQVIVKLKDYSSTKSTADMSSFENTIKDIYMDEEEKDMYEAIKDAQNQMTTTTTTSKGTIVIVTDPVSGEKVTDPVSGEFVTTVVTTQPTTTEKTLFKKEQEIKDKEKKEKEEKEAKNKKETTILLVMLGVIGGVVLIGGSYAAIKIMKASQVG